MSHSFHAEETRCEVDLFRLTSNKKFNFKNIFSVQVFLESDKIDKEIHRKVLEYKNYMVCNEIKFISYSDNPCVCVYFVQ